MSETEASAPGPHPTPPTDIVRRSLPLAEHTGPWVRVHRATHNPLYFGRSGAGRFDAPDRGFGVLYVAEDVHGAFIETFGRRTGVNYVAYGELVERRIARITSARPLRLVDFSGRGLALLGADARLTTGNHSASQVWAGALHAHPEAPDGVLYRARHDPSRVCIALFDVVEPLLTTESLGALTDDSHQQLLGEVLRSYGFGLVGALP